MQHRADSFLVATMSFRLHKTSKKARASARTQTANTFVLISAALGVLFTAPHANAQRQVRETPAQWRAVKEVKVTPATRWCTSIDEAGCDFKSIEDLSLLPDGGIVAVSQSANVMRHFGANGRFIGEVGRRGDGPGEFQSLMSAQYRDSAMHWFDVRAMRLASVSLDGKAGPVTRLMPPATMQMMYVVGNDLVVFDVPATPTSGPTVNGVYRTVPVNGEPKVLATVSTPSLFRTGTNFRAIGGPFAPRIIADVGVGGDIAHSNGDSYWVDVFPAGGKPWRYQTSIDLRPVGKTDTDSIEAMLLKTFRVSRVADLAPIVRSQLQDMPDVFPPIAAIKVLRDGTVWIRPHAMPDDKTWRWDVFSREGTRIGRAQLPVGANVRDGTRQWILVVELNDDDVPSVVKYTVQ
jgi:hypothetical protein